MRLVIPLFLVAGALACTRPPGVSTTPPGGHDRLIFKDDHGRVLTEKDLQGYDGHVNWEIVGAERVSAEATHLHEEGRKAGSRGEYAKAHQLLAQAQKLAPDWPYPSYDDGFTYLLEGKPQEAEAAYTIANRLAPRGFFTVRTAVDALSRERLGTLPKGTYTRYLSLEWTEDPAKQKAILDGLARDAPAFAPVWKEIADRTKDDAQKLEALNRGLAAHPDDETLGILTTNKALLLSRNGQKDEAVRMLGELALDSSATLGTESIARATLANLTGRHAGAE